MKLMILSLFLIVAACSDNQMETSNNKQHVFSEQKTAIDKANEVENMLNTGFENRNQQIGAQSK